MIDLGLVPADLYWPLLRLSRLIAAPEKWANHTEIPALFNEDNVILGVSAQK
jgi:hypothetical protein